jgi:hypothetical protein
MASVPCYLPRPEDVGGVEVQNTVSTWELDVGDVSFTIVSFLAWVTIRWEAEWAPESVWARWRRESNSDSLITILAAK